MISRGSRREKIGTGELCTLRHKDPLVEALHPAPVLVMVLICPGWDFGKKCRIGKTDCRGIVQFLDTAQALFPRARIGGCGNSSTAGNDLK